MPCYEGRDHVETKVVYETGISPWDIEQVNNRVKWLEAGLCAILSELERRGIAPEVVAEASRNGLIGLMDFWKKHNASDEARIASILHNYSKDEQAVMRKLLNT